MAAAAHRLSITGKCVSLVLYRTARMPKFPLLQELSRLGFALSQQELHNLAHPEDDVIESAPEAADGTVADTAEISCG
eukprot:3516638-Amphidinium_carterae.1